jgi:XTP/dITP diphosphohydrolase
MKRLSRIVARLRRECPWDRKQTVFSLRRNVIEESYELAQAIRDRDYDRIREEVGDYIFVGLFLNRILEDTGHARPGAVFDGISRKLVNRHPHIFGRVRVRNAEDVVRNWHRIKEQEKGESVLNGIPVSLPALQRAESIQKRAKRVGFDWHDRRDVLNKIVEEVEELRAELRVRRAGRRRRVREELGDLLFALVNAARHMDIDAEDALHRANAKFIRRFRALEREFRRQGRRLEDCTLEEMDAVWEAHKRKARRLSTTSV